jgi:hypothetical protein
VSLTELVKSASNIRFGKGISARIVAVFAVGIAAITAIAVSGRESPMIYAIVSGIFALIVWLAWRLTTFAAEHPDAALMEGTEITQHRVAMFTSESRKPVTALEPAKLGAERSGKIEEPKDV